MIAQQRDEDLAHACIGDGSLVLARTEENKQQLTVFPTRMSGSSPPLPFVGVPIARQLSHSTVPPLTDLVLETLADNCANIVDLQGIAEEQVIALLAKIMQRGRLDYRLACIFRDAGHAELSEAMRSLDLFAAVPSHNSIGRRHR